MWTKKIIIAIDPLIFYIFQITDLLKIKGSLLTADIEKPSDSADHQFLINVPKAFGFEKN